MTAHAEPLDITDSPDLRRLAEEVKQSRAPRMLRAGDEDLALVMPLPGKRRRAKTQADYAAFRSAAGGWKDLIDVDQFIKNIYESRRISTRPPVEL